MKLEIEELNQKINNNKIEGGEGEMNPKKFEELKQQNILYFNKLQEAQKKIQQANTMVAKAKKFNICISYVSQLIGIFNPQDDKQTYLFNKLKSFVDEYEKEKSKKKA